jgi:hypothetical protein
MFFLVSSMIAYNFLLIVSTFTITNNIYFGEIAAYCYNYFIIDPMTVTTRSQSKHFQNVNYVHSFTSTSGSILSSVASPLMLTGNATTTAF